MPLSMDVRDILIDYLQAWSVAMYNFRRFLEYLEGIELW